MNPEFRDELAAMFALDLLEGQEREDAILLLKTDTEFARVVHEFQADASAFLPFIAASAPPVATREKLLNRLHALADETPVIVTPDRFSQAESPRSSSTSFWLAWGAAALLAVGCFWFGSESHRLDQARLAAIAAQNATAQKLEQSLAQVEAAQQSLQQKTEELKLSQTETQRLANAVPALEKQLAELRETNTLAKLRIVALQSEVAEFQKSTAVVVWNPEKQEGIIEMANLPPLPDTKDYQLWLIDPAYAKPVDGGIIGSAGTAFHPTDKVNKVDAFAISVERKGGVPVAEGPVIFVGK